MMCFHSAQDGIEGTLGCLAALHLWQNRLSGRTDIIRRRCLVVVIWQCQGAASSQQTSLASAWPEGDKRDTRSSGWKVQLKVQISLPPCSLHEWSHLCNTEDVLNGRVPAVNHLIITAGESQPPCIIKPCFGSSNHSSLNHHHACLS